MSAPKIESFIVVHNPNPPGTSILMTKNCSKKRALRIWKKVLRRNYNRFGKGTYVVAYGKGTFEVKSFADFIV